MLYTLIKIFRKPFYATLAGVIALSTFIGVVLMQNFSLLFDILGDASIPLGTKALFFFQLLSSITTNFTLFAATTTILSSLLFGLNVALMIYYIRTRPAAFSGKAFGFGGGGLIAGILGIGCAACGSLLLTAFLPIATAGALITFLPLHGGEFMILGVILLSVSLFIITKQIARPAVCEVK